MNKNNLLKPKKLQKGDTVGIISPAGSVANGIPVEKIAKVFNDRGYKIKIAPHAGDKHNYLAGSDENRLKDLTDFFEDDEIKAIICTRGGYGTQRLLSKIDYGIIAENLKIFAGYSDITTLLNTFLNKSGLITFHAPLAVSDFGCDEPDKYTMDSFFNMLEGKISLPHTYENPFEYICINSGMAEGQLIGGNLAVLCGLPGTPYFPDTDGKIILLEDIGENLYKIDRMLTQLKLAGVFDRVKGVLFGRFSNIPDNAENPEEQAIKIITGILKNYKIPVGYGFPASHEKQKATLPIGAEYKFNAESGKLTLIGEYFI